MEGHCGLLKRHICIQYTNVRIAGEEQPKWFSLHYPKDNAKLGPKVVQGPYKTLITLTLLGTLDFVALQQLGVSLTAPQKRNRGPRCSSGISICFWKAAKWLNKAGVYCWCHRIDQPRDKPRAVIGAGRAVGALCSSGERALKCLYPSVSILHLARGPAA